MVIHGFENSLASRKGTTVRTQDPERFPEPGIAPVELYFSHKQKYGLPAPIDAFARIAEELDGKTLREAKWEPRTGDIVLFFEPNVELQMFKFTGYEDWEIHFSNGTGEYSNYAF
jgi:hypothetical protein